MPADLVDTPADRAVAAAPPPRALVRKLGLALNIAAYLALAVLPVIAMTADWRANDLAGVRAEVEAPELHPPGGRRALLASIYHEIFQPKADAWFQRYLGLTGTSIGIDNSILLHVFGEAKPGSTVRVGDDGVYFIDDDINYFNKSGAQVTSAAYLDRLATRLATLQQSLAARGKALVPVIVPSKTSIYRDKVSASWTADLGEPRPTDVQTYQALLRALAAHGVRHVDVRDLIARRIAAGTPRRDLWMPEARHWSGYTGCLTLVEVTRLYAELSGRPRPPMRCQLKMVEPQWNSADFDLMRLLNALLLEPSQPRLPSVESLKADPPAPEPRPTVSVVATSFGWTLTSQLLETAQWSAIYMNYYNSHLFKIGEQPQEKMKLGSPLWRESALDKDLYIFDLFEGYLAEGNYIDQFLDQAGPGILAGEKP